MELCARCGQPATGFATIDDDRLCHGEGRDCYVQAQATSEVVVILGQ